MFEKLKRAKSFVVKTKPPREELDLPETSHLRRTIPINTEILLRVSNDSLRQNSPGRLTRLNEREQKQNVEKTCDVDSRHKSHVTPDDKKFQDQFKRFTFQNECETFNHEKNNNSFTSRETSKRKIFRSKSARDSKSNYMKKYANNFNKNENM